MSPEGRSSLHGDPSANPHAMMDPRVRFVSAMAYAAYEEALQHYEATPLPEGASEVDRSRKSSAAINLQRSTRITRTYVPGDGITRALRAVPGGYLWGVLSEVWCGDSAQIVPYLARIAALREDITFRVMLRDMNPDVMDRYLTGGKRCIPKLIAWDASGKERFTWGPRPAEGQAIMDNGLAAGLSKAEHLEKLHLWYGRDRGKAIEAELAAVFRSMS